jgi:histidinol phosphatase-like PHP family hydrolase/calcineurin-like phosphoesterase family protein
MNELNVLVITDIHYIGCADHVCKAQKRRATFALELVQRVLRSVDEKIIDLILLMGDLVDKGDAPGAEKDIKVLASILKTTGKPVIVVPGNHDGSPESVFKAFDDYEGIHEVKGYQFISFNDSYNEKDIANRCWTKMDELFSQADPDRPLIVLQHNPVYPPIDRAYPYNLRDADRITEYYEKKGVLLSVSGHAHWGIPTIENNGVSYLTCPCLCEEPFKYTLITFRGKEYEVKECSLLQKKLNLSDFHIHTNYAYCAEDVEPKENIKRAKEFGLQRIAFTEHAAQLYVSGKDYWAARFIDEPEIIENNKNTPLNRMKKYREEMEAYRSNDVLVGLEVELDCNGKLTMLEEDMSGWDILVGAVHYLPQRFEKGSKDGFMWATELLLKSGIDILAHPFRYFIRSKQPVPKELYRPMVKLLSHFNTAVELNYHTNDNDPDFFKLCIEHNVPISLGSDGHHLSEIGSFNRHIELLEQIHPLDKFEEILYKHERASAVFQNK